MAAPAQSGSMAARSGADGRRARRPLPTPGDEPGWLGGHSPGDRGMVPRAPVYWRGKNRPATKKNDLCDNDARSQGINLHNGKAFAAKRQPHILANLHSGREAREGEGHSRTAVGRGLVRIRRENAGTQGTQTWGLDLL